MTQRVVHSNLWPWVCACQPDLIIADNGTGMRGMQYSRQTRGCMCLRARVRRRGSGSRERASRWGSWSEGSWPNAWICKAAALSSLGARRCLHLCHIARHLQFIFAALSHGWTLLWHFAHLALRCHSSTKSRIRHEHPSIVGFRQNLGVISRFLGAKVFAHRAFLGVYGHRLKISHQSHTLIFDCMFKRASQNGTDPA